MNEIPASGIEIRFDSAFDTAGYVNIAPGKACAQSSPSRWSHADGAAALVNAPVKTDFAIHTESEAEPWWSIDLGAPHRDLIILVYNRALDAKTKYGSIRERVLPLVLQSSEDGERWTALVDVAQAFGDVASGAPLSIRLRRRAGQQAIRYLRIYVRKPRAVLHLQLLQVFVPDAATCEAEDASANLLRAFHDCIAPGVAIDIAFRSFARDRLAFFPPEKFASINAVHVAPYERLGNRIVGAVNGILFAEEQEIGRVYLDFGDLMPDFRMPEHLRFGAIEVLLRKPVAGDDDFLMRAHFYHGNYFPPALHWKKHSLTRILRQAIRPILMSGITEGAFDRSTVLVHIRSGDLFAVEGRGRNANYVQPPLAYYTSCLKHAEAQHPVARVILVYEDRANPCVDALESHLAALGMPHVMQSGTLREDTAAIFGARRIIAGHGTFVPALAAMSSQLEAVYFFRQGMLSRLFDADAVRIFVADDRDGQFIPYGTWANTAAQRHLMLDYPGAGIAIRAAGGR